MAISRKTYEVIAQRDGNVWLLRVPAIERSTQALRLDQAEDMARNLIAIMTGKAEDSFDVEIVTNLDPELAALISEATFAKAEAAKHQNTASVAQRLAVRKLTESGYTVRDTGRLLGLTYQRIAQLRADQ